MKILRIPEATNHIKSLPKDSVISVYYDIVTAEIIVIPQDRHTKDVLMKPMWRMICNGKPERFFTTLNILLYQHTKNKPNYEN